jgi:integrase
MQVSAQLRVNTLSIDYSSYQVVIIRLDSGEVVPMLVESGTWVPARLANRWALLHRRRRSASNTLRKHLFTLKLVYCWAKSGDFDLDEYLLTQHELSRDDLKRLVTELQEFRSRQTRKRVLSTEEKRSEGQGGDLEKRIAEANVAAPIDPDLGVVENFLSWVSDPINTGVKPDRPQTTISIQRLNSTKANLRAALDRYRVGTFPSRSPEPLNVEELKCIHHAIDPLTAEGRIKSMSLLFPKTPWTLETRLRNWLMFCLAQQCGLRIGEILKLTLEDIISLNPGGALTVHVRRRPDDPDDSRTHPPSVKTSERVLELSTEIRWGTRLYLTQRPPLGRVAGKSPYLFVTAAGNPLSYLSAYRALQVIGRRVGFTNLTWHKLRHTWADSLARELFEINGIEEHGIEKLRYLGGWAETSRTPFLYIRNAVREAANNFLRKRNERLYHEHSSLED